MGGTTSRAHEDSSESCADYLHAQGVTPVDMQFRTINFSRPQKYNPLDPTADIGSPRGSASTKDTDRPVFHNCWDSERSPASSATETGHRLKEAVDSVVLEKLVDLENLNMKFSFTVSDPLLNDCPIIACSTGFTKLSGHEQADVIGCNCRFLTDCVPPEQVDQDVQSLSDAFCEATMLGRKWEVPACYHRPWMPKDRPCDELFLMQRNARKDLSLFNNFSYMKVFELGSVLGEEQPYIVVLHSELSEGMNALSEMAKHIDELDVIMEKVKLDLATLFFVQCSSFREATPKAPQWGSHLKLYANLDLHPLYHKGREFDKVREVVETGGLLHPPPHLYAAFKSAEVQPWKEGRFTHIQKLNDAPRNQGSVHLAHDSLTNELIAIKQMPNEWLQGSHEEFMRKHPAETELPWQDIGCTRFLNSVNFKYACHLEGVYRNKESTFVASSFASEGDFFDVSLAGVDPGPGLEREVTLAPLVCQLFCGLKQLHDMQIAHRDISLENVLLTRAGCRSEVKIIDYSMASTERRFPCSSTVPSGKQAYQAPEMYFEKSYDAFLSDAFAAGVLVYTLFLKDYPWLSTLPGICKNFEFVDTHGFREFCVRRSVRASNLKVANCASESLLTLLDGMLSLDPRRRLTFGERQWTDRRSVWDEPWMKHYSKNVNI